MKKIILIMNVLLFSVILVSCKNTKNIESNSNVLKLSDTDTLKINVETDEVKIMQLTDVHLTYGFDYLDRKTFKLIDKLIEKEEPDIIVVTGDLFMTLSAKSVFKKFIKFIDKYDIPWSIIFGNHEAEFHSMETIVKTLESVKTNNLYFLNNPNLIPSKEDGYSNFRLEIYNNDTHLLNLYLLDSKVNRRDGVKDSRYPYDYLSKDQVNWYEDLVKDDLVKSLAFMHMPLIQFLEYDGPLRGEKSWPQAVDTGFYDVMKKYDKTLGVFVGHDHLNSFHFKIPGDNILLSYGLSSGYNSYGNVEKGARFITFNNLKQEMKTYTVDGKEVGVWKKV